MKDPIVEEVRRARDAHAKRFNYDLDAIVEENLYIRAGNSTRLLTSREAVEYVKQHWKEPGVRRRKCGGPIAQSEGTCC